MMEGLANDMLVIILQHVSNQQVYTLNLLLYVNYISSKKKEQPHHAFDLSKRKTNHTICWYLNKIMHKKHLAQWLPSKHLSTLTVVHQNYYLFLLQPNRELIGALAGRAARVWNPYPVPTTLSPALAHWCHWPHSPADWQTHLLSAASLLSHLNPQTAGRQALWPRLDTIYWYLLNLATHSSLSGQISLPHSPKPKFPSPARLPPCAGSAWVRDRWG